MICCLAIIGCSSTPKEITREKPASTDAIVHEVRTAAKEVLPPETSPFSQARRWSKRFIQTGVASGIMIEFSGIKKDKSLHALYSAIELWRYPLDTMRVQEHFSLSVDGKTSTADPKAKGVPGFVTLTTKINDLRQAFFKVSPGKYLLRQTKSWADQSYVRDVEVLEGNYSILQIDVYTPWLAKTKQLSESVDEK